MNRGGEGVFMSRVGEGKTGNVFGRSCFLRSVGFETSGLEGTFSQEGKRAQEKPENPAALFLRFLLSAEPCMQNFITDQTKGILSRLSNQLLFAFMVIRGGKTIPLINTMDSRSYVFHGIDYQKWEENLLTVNSLYFDFSI